MSQTYKVFPKPEEYMYARKFKNPNMFLTIKYPSSGLDGMRGTLQDAYPCANHLGFNRVLGMYLLQMDPFQFCKLIPLSKVIRTIDEVRDKFDMV